MVNLFIKAPQLGIIDPIVDIFFAKKRIEEKSVLYEKLNEASLYQKVCIVVNVPQRIATLLDLKLKLYYCDSRTKENFVFNVQQNGNEVNIIETKIDTTLKNNEIIYMAIAEVELYTQDKIKMKILEKLSPLNIFMQLTWGVRDFNPEYSLKLIKEFTYKDSYFYRFFGEGKWFKIKKSNIAPWMEIAWEEFEKWSIGNWTEKSGKGYERAEEYIKKAGDKFRPDVEAWCACFTDWVLKTTNEQKGTQYSTVVRYPPRALNYETEDRYPNKESISPSLEKPPYGVMAVLKKIGEDEGHIGFIVNFQMKGEKGFAYLLGGNQNDKLCVQVFDVYKKKEKIIFKGIKSEFELRCYVYPKEYNLSELGDEKYIYKTEGYVAVGAEKTQ